MRIRHWLAVVIVAAYAAAGCSSNKSSSSSSSDSSTQPSADVSPASTRPIPPDSIFAKVRTGETYDEVIATIGRPTSEFTYITGNAFRPFNFGGSDTNRTAAHYKGVGIIVFSNDSRYSSGRSVMEVDYDPNESGYEKSN